MLIMKKDMGGAACVLAAAHMIMDAKLKVRLRVLIPAVENAISGDAFRPLDVYKSRKGITVEIGNTDAEGRLVLADALALADEESARADRRHGDPDRRRARRARAGPAAVLSPTTMRSPPISRAMRDAEHDPLWRLPLWRPYESMLDSKTADINNVGGPLRGLDHGGAVPQPLRHRREGLGAFRHLCAGRRARSPRAPRAASARSRARSMRC